MPTKVARLLETYDLESLGLELEQRWLGKGYERESLRKLARRFNERLLGERMTRAGLSPLDGEVENTYRLLTDDDVSAGMRTQAERELERAGIDVDALRREFVSHQAIHTYLTSDRELEGPSSQTTPEDRLERDAASIQRLSSRLTAVTEDTVKRYRETDLLESGSVSVLVDVNVLCEECGEQYDVATFLERGGCRCRE
ncbi:rod-determining factor RdfA [Saliphagus sp. GCM10025317]|uniref:rod-determining factor RdfA n=1 Tax=Natronosalvus caseinilyticus TaxID=2953747 RepID=UPI0028B06531|nr:rod-determining factor RdfA [Natronosalvus caseinilyticus]